jgi:hypothetical protein
MRNSFDTKLKWIAAFSAAAVLVALVIVPAAASKPVSGPNEPSVQDILTQGHNWAAKGRLLDVNGGLLRQTLPSAQDIQTERRWSAQGRLSQTKGDLFRGSMPSAQDIRTQADNWAAKGRLLNSDGGLVAVATQSDNAGSAGFHWSEFGIGAGAMLALVLLVGVVALGLHVTRPGSLRQGRTA